jgi:hypothetical protein
LGSFVHLDEGLFRVVEAKFSDEVGEDLVWLCCLGGGRIDVFGGDLDEGQCRVKKTEWMTETKLQLRVASLVNEDLDVVKLPWARQNWRSFVTLTMDGSWFVRTLGVRMRQRKHTT